MTVLIRFLDANTGRWANLRMDNDDPCWISVAQIGVLVKKSNVGLFGTKLYDQRDIYKAASTAKALWEQYTEDKTPPGMTDPVLKAFANAALHCSSLAEVKRILDQVDEAQSQ